MNSPRKILLTSALPYANGPIHLGHMVEYVQTDIWARFQRLNGNTCYFIGADDAHGTPVMLRAREENIEPDQLAARCQQEHMADFRDFAISFDNYHSTHSEENRQLCETIYQRLKADGYIHKKTIKQAYDPEQRLFLPDRFIRGNCPRCDAADQYGDNCEVCGATYDPLDLKNPVSVLSGATPVEKESEHEFFDLPAFTAPLQQWLQGGCLQEEVANKLQEWFQTGSGLKPWDISRDAPYFGFRIPDTDEKYFYVWLDAPVGYFASFRQFCDRENIDFDEYLRPDSDTEMFHFIGKDIIYFHGLFWPAMLAGSGFRLPSGLCAHGFLTVNGGKMSKSRGTFITARAYLRHLNPEYLRYFFACRLDSGISDIDLNLDDFILRVNSDLVGKVVNIASRSAKLLSGFSNRLGDALPDQALFDELADAESVIADYYERREYAAAMREIMRLADRINQYIDHSKPWEIARTDPASPVLQEVCTAALNGFRQLLVYLKPVLPVTVAAAEKFLDIPPLAWSDASRPLLAHTTRPYEPLMQRVNKTAVQAMVDDSRDPEAMPADHGKPTEKAADATDEKSQDPTITIEDFAQLDLRVARIVQVETVEGADRLLRLQLDLGDSQRVVLAGIRRAYEPAALVNRLVIVVANLQPRKMRFGVSEGMILAAGGDDGGPFLLSPDDGAVPGMKVR